MNSSQSWFSASELLGLPGVSANDKGVRRQAKKQGWEWRNRFNEMGRPCKEYHISSLPQETQTHLQQQEEYDVDYPEKPRIGETELSNIQSPISNSQSISTETLINSDIPAPAPSKPRKVKVKGEINREEDRINAKVEIMTALEAFCREKNLQKITCHHVFAEAYNKGRIKVSWGTSRVVPMLSPSTLRRWYKTLGTGSVEALAGRYGNRAGCTKIDAFPQVRDFVLGVITQYPHATGRHVLAALQGRFEEEILPSLRTLERWMANWKEENKELFTATANPDAWKNKYMTAFGSYSEDVERLNQLWEMDSTPADVMLGEGRYHLIGCIDVFSRRLKLLVVPKSKAFAIGTLLRQCLLDWGVPETVKTDNGKDYTANYLQRLFVGLDIRQKLCQPFQPWQKPHIERAFRTFSHDLLEMLDGYVGHDVAERQELRARQSFSDRLLTKNQEIVVNKTALEFQSFCNIWTDSIYANQPHQGLDNETPFQVLTNWRGNTKVVADERALDILLAEAPGANGLRVVGKKGIQLEGTYFIAPELEAWIGQTVQVRFDPLDLGKIYVFDGDFKLVCIAEDPARTGMNRQEVATRARHLQQQRVQDGKRALKQIAKKVNVAEAVEDILQEAEANSNVVAFPAPKEIHTSHGLETAADVVKALKPKEYAPMTTEELAEADAAFSRIEQPEMEVVRDEDYFCRLWAQTNAGLTIATRDWQWMKHYASTPEGRGILRFLDVTEVDFSGFVNRREAKIS